MNVVLFSVILAIVLAAYFSFLYNKTSRNRNTRILSYSFAAIFVIGFILHFIIYYKAAIGRLSLYDYITLAFYSGQHSFKMFFASSPVYKMLSDIENTPFIYYAFSIIFYMAVMTSGFFIFNFISRSLYTKRWLGKNCNREIADKGGNSIFLGTNRYSTILATNLRKSMTAHDQEGMIISIELPDENDQMENLSIWEIFRQILVSRNSESGIAPFDIMLKVKDNMSDLMPWLCNPKNNVYILSDDMAQNISIIEKLLEHNAIKCHIYCHARKEGLIAKYDTIADMHNQVTIIDSSYLAVEGLKRNPDLHPVNFVDIGVQGGRRAGWVSDKGFTCAIMGFGETGKESLPFLYEFGAFPAKNTEKAPFKCYVFDSNMESASGDFIRRVPGINPKEIKFLPDQINTPSYWKEIKEIIDSLNYVVVSMGNDKTTLNAAIDLAEYAYRYRKSDNPKNNLHNFVILLRLCDPENMDIMTVDAANKIFGNCLRVFGRIDDIWNFDVISNDSVNAVAERFYNSSETLASGSVSVSWKDKLKLRSQGTYKDRSKAQRQVAQTYSNCLHMETKKRLCDKYYHSQAEHIVLPDAFDGKKHYIGNDPDAGKVMEYLAICEKLRWNASHEILGYVKGDVTDDQLKTHQYICSYHDVEPKVKHYDWLVVRNSLTDN